MLRQVIVVIAALAVCGIRATSELYKYTNAHVTVLDIDNVVYTTFSDDEQKKQFSEFSEKGKVTCSAKFGVQHEVGNWHVFHMTTTETYGSLSEEENYEIATRNFFCAGFAEGLLTFKEINQFYTNMYSDWFTDFHGSPDPEPILKFIEDNYEFTAEEFKKNYKESQFWRDVGLVLAQLKGMYEGYLESMSNYPKEPVLEFKDFLFINADGDLQTLEIRFPKPAADDLKLRGEKKLPFKQMKEEKCSALIKLIKDENGKDDVLIGHTTWDHFENLGPRVLKYFKMKGDPYRSYAMSSSPGMLSSVDDFFVTGSQMVVLETSTTVYNSTLVKTLTPNSLFSWMRARVANQETSAEKWAETFSRYNSGTYNNQWMVVSASKFLGDIEAKKKGEEVDGKGILILEQMPTFIKFGFEFKRFWDDGYWASYNIPYFDDIFEIANYSQQLPKDEYNYNECPRAKIFHRELSKGRANDLEDFKKLIRYNDFENDEFSKGNGCFGISSRCDLNDVLSPAYKASGGIDAKVVSLRNVLEGFDNVLFHAQLGPTHEDQDPFEWASLEERLHKKGIAFPTHLGQNKVYNFDWMTFGPKNFSDFEEETNLVVS